MKQRCLFWCVNLCGSGGFFLLGVPLDIFKPSFLGIISKWFWILVLYVGSLQWKGACNRWNSCPDDQCFEAISADIATWFSCLNIFHLATTAAAYATVHVIHIASLFLFCGCKGRACFSLYDSSVLLSIIFFCMESFSGGVHLWMHCRSKELEVAISYGFDVECIWSCIETWFLGRAASKM
jgi:hypothetical protein